MNNDRTSSVSLKQAARPNADEDYDPPPRYDTVSTRSARPESHSRSITPSAADRSGDTSPRYPRGHDYERSTGTGAAYHSYDDDEYDDRHAGERTQYSHQPRPRSADGYYAPDTYRHPPSGTGYGYGVGYRPDPYAASGPSSASDRERLAYMEGMMHARDGEYNGRRRGLLGRGGRLRHGSRRGGLISSIVSGISQRGGSGAGARDEEQRRQQAYEAEYYGRGRSRRDERHEAITGLVAGRKG